MIEMLVAVDPVDQRYEAPPEAVRIKLPPWHSKAAPPMAATGLGNGLSTYGAEVTLPQLLVAITVYVPGAKP